MQKLQHELALVGSIRLMQVFESVLRPEEQLDAHNEIYSVILAVLQNYHTESELIHTRVVDASKN